MFLGFLQLSKNLNVKVLQALLNLTGFVMSVLLLTADGPDVLEGRLSPKINSASTAKYRQRITPK